MGGSPNFYKGHISYLLVDAMADRAANWAGMQVAHYSSFESADKIIRNKTLWLRNARYMNDTSEIAYSAEIVEQELLLDSPHTRTFWDMLDRVTQGRGEELRQVCLGIRDKLFNDTYICCVSEHDPGENELGRLSMWRTYGKPEGVALVSSMKFVAVHTQMLATYSYPVAYWSPEHAREHLRRAMLALEDQEPELSCTAVDEVFDGIVQGVLALMLCLKHPAFHEEREWRVVYRPGFEASEYMQSRIVTIKGTEQLIYELPLRDDPKLGIFGIKPQDLLERVIVGPTANAKAAQTALVAALESAGFTDAAGRVTCSNVPYREIA